MNDPNYAGFWHRFSACLIDIFLIILSANIINKIVIGFQLSSGTGGLLLFILYIVLPWLYFTIMESSTRQATYGKKAVGVTVTTLGIERISFGRANVCLWGKLISSLIVSRFHSRWNDK
ncbi:MAG: RDD family protein [Deltaproteobacteria bacterium]|nr:RDD family protein [Deltaproteobacteria bacterium]